MTYWARPGSVKAANITGAAFISLDKLAGSCSPGPLAKNAIPILQMSRLLGKVPAINNEATTNTAKDVFGGNPILLCADIQSPFFGVWGLNATGDVEIQNWEQHPENGGAPWGYYVHLYAEIPTASQYYELGKVGGGWSEGANVQMQDYQPKVWEDIRRLMGFPPTNVAGGNVPGLPPGPSGFSSATPATHQSIEFSVIDGGFWVAKTPAASAASKEGNPHPGISIINPGEWERVSSNQAPSAALDLDEYKEMGWSGLDQQFIAWQGTDSSPASEELGTAMEAAMNGDAGALRALKGAGVKPPTAGKLEKAGGFLDKVGSLF